ARSERPESGGSEDVAAGAAGDGQEVILEVVRIVRSFGSFGSFPPRPNGPNDPNMMSISSRLAEVRARIDAAARSAGRDPSSVRLVAVSKTFPIDAIREAYASGQRDFGENRVQEALQKIASATDLEIRWHLLGHLQLNKARKAGSVFTAIHSVDSLELLKRIDASAGETGRTAELLLQVDLAGEATKFGASPDEVPRLLDAAAECRASRVTGLMTLPPLPDSPEDARPW